MKLQDNPYLPSDTPGLVRQLTSLWRSLVLWSRGVLDNVDTTGATNTNVLAYDSATDTWKPVAATASSGGTVTSVSVTPANGVSGSVATATTTPAISLTLGAITPSSVAASGTVTGSNLSGTNTGDQTSVTGNAGTATKLLTPRAINGVNFDGSAPITINAVDATAREPAITAGTTLQYWRGDKSWQTLNTAAVPESGSLYFTNARAIACTLTSYAIGTNAALAATDTIIGAFGKLEAKANAKANSATTLAGYGITDGVSTARTISTTAPLTGGGALSANLTLAMPAATASVNGYLTSTDWATFNNKAPAAPPVTSISAAYTFVLADANGRFLHPSADTSARTWTIPANASVAYAVGTQLYFNNQNGAGAVTIAITTDTLRGTDGVAGSKVIAANGQAQAVKITTTEWQIWGNGLTNAITNLLSSPATATGWTFDTGGNFTGGKANFTSVANQHLTHTAAISLVNGQTYTISWDATNWTTGAVQAQFTTGGVAPADTAALINGNGRLSQTLTCTSAGENSFRFQASAAGTNMTIDNVTVV